jgi:hypothetical protein
MSTTFTKLFSSITESTIWAEPDAVRIVWITMLAMADRHGRIWASIPGLANRARVSLEACEDALDRFQKPDKYSRTPDHEGRRVEAIDGGWRLLNHAKYRAIRDEESALEAKRKWAAKNRAKEKVEKVDPSRSPSNTVDASRDNAEAEAEAEADTEAEKDTHTPKPPRGPRFAPPTREELDLEAAKVGLPANEVDAFVGYYGANGWKVGRNPMKSWRHALGGWAARWRERTNGHTSNHSSRHGQSAADIRRSLVAGADDVQRQAEATAAREREMVESGRLPI